MPTRQENLTAAIDSMAARMREVASERKPNYSVDGESYSWESYLAMLSREFSAMLQNEQRAAGPWKVRARNVT